MIAQATDDQLRRIAEGKRVTLGLLCAITEDTVTGVCAIDIDGGFAPQVKPPVIRVREICRGTLNFGIWVDVENGRPDGEDEQGCAVCSRGLS